MLLFLKFVLFNYNLNYVMFRSRAVSLIPLNPIMKTFLFLIVIRSKIIVPNNNVISSPPLRISIFGSFYPIMPKNNYPFHSFGFNSPLNAHKNGNKPTKINKLRIISKCSWLLTISIVKKCFPNLWWVGKNKNNSLFPIFFHVARKWNFIITYRN